MQSARDAAAYRESWRGEACQNQSIPGNRWTGIGCAEGRVTEVRLSGGARGSLDGFGQLTALSELHLDSNRFNGKSPSTCLHRILRGWVPAYVLSCRCLPGLHWACAPTTPPCQAQERGMMTTCTGTSLCTMWLLVALTAPAAGLAQLQPDVARALIGF